MASSMVIKVKYGDTLRRFNGTVDEKDQLGLDMAGLKAKVSSLFSFKPDADISLTYIDEDGDVVTLIDDDDLRDVMRQQLKFLRIDVQLNNGQGGRSFVRSSGSSTPLRSPRPPVLNVNRAVNDALQYMPEALQGTLLKLSLDLASKATSSSPALAEIVDALAKIQLSGITPDSQLSSGVETSASGKASDIPVTPPVASGSNEKGQPQVSTKSTETPEPVSKTNLVVPKGKEVVDGNVNEVVGATVTPRRPSVDLNKLPAECESSEPPLVKSVQIVVRSSDDRKEKKKKSSDVQKGKSVGSEGPGSSSIPLKHINPAPPEATDGHFNPFSECPFFGLPIMRDSVETRVPHRPFHHFKRHHAEVMGGIFHRGIRCDGCGVHPITGPRFKSKVKEDYDLCSICFADMGNEADYVRIDRPMSFRHPRAFKGPHDQAPWVVPPALPRVVFGCGRKSGRPKLDSRFVLDVNVIDGTLMPPSVPFTKIWRMRNNGGIVWPRGTQLVWIGGDKFSQELSVEMEIPANGVPLDSELDIAVDFIAPECPGRYISYWRMSSPSGQKFGQRVWVLIQVDALLKNPFLPVPNAPLDLNVPSFSTGGTKVVPVKDEDRDFPQPGFAEPKKPATEPQLKSELEKNFPINDSLLVGQGVSAPPATVPMSPVSYPIVDLTELTEEFLEASPAAPGSASNISPPVVSATSSAPPIVGDAALNGRGNNPREDALLKELEEMGFRQVDLNKEILRMNEYDLEQSVDELCGVSEWDPMLDELEEMGFHDTEVNKKLLAKNNGSIKRVVLELINGEKP